MCSLTPEMKFREGSLDASTVWTWSVYCVLLNSICVYQAPTKCLAKPSVSTSVFLFWSSVDRDTGGERGSAGIAKCCAPLRDRSPSEPGRHAGGWGQSQEETQRDHARDSFPGKRFPESSCVGCWVPCLCRLKSKANGQCCVVWVFSAHGIRSPATVPALEPGGSAFWSQIFTQGLRTAMAGWITLIEIPGALSSFSLKVTKEGSV